MVIIILVILVLGYFLYQWYSNRKWNKQPLRNFPFVHKGKVYWYSRSVATTIGVFCKNKKEEWCVLANQRGKGAPDFQGFWNMICGYLEHDVNGAENCQKEVFEETSVFVPINRINFFNVNTEPTENKQNVTLRYIAVLHDKCEDIELSDENSEKNEVSDIKWIPIKEIENYQWAFGHKDLIGQMFNEINK